MSIIPILKGLLLGGSMIIPIGAQNAFVINQGIKRNHHLIAAAVCMLCDILLITIGVFGSGSLVNEGDLIYQFLIWGGAIFLFIYGAGSLKKALKPVDSSTEVNKNEAKKTIKLVILSGLAVTLLNPHAYLDTIMILGGASLQYMGIEKLKFALGCMLASVIWFYFISMLAAKLAPILSSIKVQRVIDIVVGLVMWIIALTLVY
ncbi:LysE/ArgO family amino acid transporter [Spartinivicinus ruber]|uniref:LysE/ArgO family amino acid transporter n=1 Tax=Spartinivicinus ruber TaxID=2683272 RepID=UPI0013D4EAB5|nr:LysE/ArgO family amino acid transporter [Spartinivicinus ruber]